jgi:DNA-binding PadR family transcriptional regulator
MAKKRKVGNLMALAVLANLIEGPAHRYEIAARLRERSKEGQMDVKWGSLYTVVQNLEKHGFLEIVGSERDGARPERTIYAVTAAGRTEADDWVRELISTPEPEPDRFVAGLSIAAMVPPDELTDLLGERLDRLETTITQYRSSLGEFSHRVPHLFLIEDEYEIAMLEAQAAWVRALREELVSGTFPGLAQWRGWHADNRFPPDPTAAEGGTPAPSTPA